MKTIQPLVGRKPRRGVPPFYKLKEANCSHQLYGAACSAGRMSMRAPAELPLTAC